MLFYIQRKFFLPKSILYCSLFTGLTLTSGCQSLPAASDNNASGAVLASQHKNLQQRVADLNQLEETLNARDAAISVREKELVTLLSELLKQKKQLENQQLQLQQASHSTRKPRSPVSTQTAQSSKGQNQTRKTATSKPKAVQDNVMILGGLEYIYLDPPGINLSARIDTGAQTSSLNALDMVEFERDGKPYIKFNIIHPETKEKTEVIRRVRGHTKIKKHKTEPQRRPIVRLRVRLGDIDEHISFTLVNRSKFNQQVLIGRNFLRDLAIVDVSKQFTQPKLVLEQ